MKSQARDSHQPLELVISTLLYLMTRYQRNPCPHTRQAIVHHLTMLHDHPNCRNADTLETTTRRLVDEWLGFIEARPPTTQQSPHLTMQ